MIYFVTLLGFVLAALVFYFRADKFGANFFLALFIFSNSFYSITSFSFISNEFRWIITRIYPYVIIPNMAAGPFMYLYFVAVVKPNFTFKPIYLLHFLPAFLFFINGSDFIFWDSAKKAQLIDSFLNDVHAVFNMPMLFMPYYTHVIFRMVQSFVYLMISVWLVFVNFKRDNYVCKNERQIPYGFYALFFLLFFGHYITTLLIGIRVNPQYDNLLSQHNELELLLTSSRTFFTLFILVSLFNPKIVFQKYFIPVPIKTFRRIKDDNNSNAAPLLGDRYDLTEINLLFTEYIQVKPYLLPGFSLNMISDGTKLPVHQISYYIKHQFDLTFNEWKNEQRIKHAVELINAGHAEQLTLESISMQCGYRSRANFVDAFKKVMGLTPSEYLAKHNKLR